MTGRRHPTAAGQAITVTVTIAGDLADELEAMCIARGCEPDDLAADLVRDAITTAAANDPTVRTLTRLLRRSRRPLALVDDPATRRSPA